MSADRRPLVPSRLLTQEATVNAEHTGEHIGRGSLVVGLGETVALDASELGAKAANLARLAGDGFPVPPGLVVTPAARDR